LLRVCLQRFDAVSALFAPALNCSIERLAFLTSSAFENTDGDGEGSALGAGIISIVEEVSLILDRCMQGGKSDAHPPCAGQNTVKSDVPGVNGIMELSGVYGRASWTVGMRSLALVRPAWGAYPLHCGADRSPCWDPFILTDIYNLLYMGVVSVHIASCCIAKEGLSVVAAQTTVVVGLGVTLPRSLQAADH
jgi:hypothetical protein